MLFEFFVPGISVAQGRPKFYRRGKHVGVYDPGKSRDWKAYVAWHVKQQLGDALDRPSERPLSMEVHFAFLRPKTLSKKIAYHIKKPDCKNLLAGVEDAMDFTFEAIQ